MHFLLCIVMPSTMLTQRRPLYQLIVAASRPSSPLRWSHHSKTSFSSSFSLSPPTTPLLDTPSLQSTALLPHPLHHHHCASPTTQDGILVVLLNSAALPDFILLCRPTTPPRHASLQSTFDDATTRRHSNSSRCDRPSTTPLLDATRFHQSP